MKVEFIDESLEEGTEVHVVGLGTFVNGEEVEFDDTQLETFEALTGRTVADAFGNDPRVKLSGPGSRTVTEKKEEAKKEEENEEEPDGPSDSSTPVIGGDN